MPSEYEGGAEGKRWEGMKNIILASFFLILNHNELIIFLLDFLFDSTCANIQWASSITHTKKSPKP